MRKTSSVFTIASVAILILAVLTLSSCHKDGCMKEIPEWCHLVDLSNHYEPVCGCDGKTYQNAGHAVCMGGVTVYIEGECK